MIIFTQDKTGIINFNNIVSVYVDKVYLGVSVDSTEKSELYNYYIKVHSCACDDDFHYGQQSDILTIAKYGTEERAKEVLEKMINAIGLGMYKYDMPQK